MSQINANSNNNSVSGLSSSFSGNAFSPLNNSPGEVDNSLYGGLGAGISPIADRDIAACTCSTGREMLKFAK